MATWWQDVPRAKFFQECLNKFDVRLSRKLGKALQPHQNEAAAHKLAKFRSGQASAAKAGAKHGFGIDNTRKGS